MKFEHFLMKPSEQQHRRLALEEEIEELQGKLNEELKINSILRYALQRPLFSCPCLSSLLPLKVQALLSELAVIEEEVAWLETKIDKLKMSLYREKQLSKEWVMKQPSEHHKMQLPSRWHNQGEVRNSKWLSAKLSHNSRYIEEGRFSLSSASDMQSRSSRSSKEEIVNGSLRNLRIIRTKHSDIIDAQCNDEPNRLSEELLRCLIYIFLKMNSENERGTAETTKHTLSCINPKGFTPITSFNCKARPPSNKDNAQDLHPYGITLDSEGTGTDGGPYNKYIKITRTSFKMAHLLDSYPTTRKLSVLLQKLCYVNLTFLSYKKKLAFWINIYNACIMHAYLQYGLSSTQERMLTLLNKAAINVGGIVLNALAIEHYILRHPSHSKYGSTDEKDMLLRHAYGLQYPEPNITFALCRGNWSSPALQVYTPEEVVNELGRAKVEYLEAFVRVTNKKKILVPKLLQWHMQDFADDIESLIEWIYSQLPPKGPLKRAIMECLNGERNLPAGKMVEIVPYDYEFQYLLAPTFEQI